MRSFLRLAVFLTAFLPAVAHANATLEEIEAFQPLEVPAKPLEVAVGIEIQQITGVDQKAENFGVVALLRFKWTDPALSYDAPAGNRDVFRILRVDEFRDYARERGAVLPSFEIRNQQSNRWVHQSKITLLPDGTAFYVDKSSLTLQAPYFDFTKYPFDRQTFYFEVVSVAPEPFIKYVAADDWSGLGGLLGEEEWILENDRMEISTIEGFTGHPSAKIALAFEGHRHTQYYLTRIFLPMLILITVSWSAFFLDDYRKRSEVAGANLLVFVGFNWMISADLPRLGYLTFLDFILQWMFVVTGAIIVFNIFLAHLQYKGRAPLAASLDSYAIRWIYPLGYIAIVGYAVARFLKPIGAPLL
ncbi:hypothetical protein [Shimia biformata]|uniref:hypothetical protein n=1 Tax=Shimia biformata TaxID=1294299 RepID=UPI00194FFAFF|nr:hypothetical protein [Shimia biformata]